MVGTSEAEGGEFVVGAGVAGRPVVGTSEGGEFVVGAGVAGRPVVGTSVAEGGEFVVGAAVAVVVTITVGGTAVNGANREMVALGRHRPLIPPGRQGQAEVSG